MKYTQSLIIILAILAYSSQALRGMEEPLTLPGNFAQLPLEMQQEITSKLSDRDLARLAQTSKQASQVLENELARRHKLYELSLWESRIKIDFSRQVSNYPDFDEFKQAVLNKLEETAKQKPNQWISLILSNNNLNSISSEDLETFIQSIAKYNIVELGFHRNKLTSLPENIFKNLYKLEFLFLDYNQMTSLPKSIYSLPNLKELYLSYNRLSKKEKKVIKKALPNVEIYF